MVARATGTARGNFDNHIPVAGLYVRPLAPNRPSTGGFPRGRMLTGGAAAGAVERLPFW